MRRWTRQFVIVLVLALAGPNIAMATPADPWQQSTNYGMNESELGGSGCTNNYGTGLQCGSSTNYSLDSNDDGGSTLGEFAVGNGSDSTNYSSGSGFNTTSEPGLMLAVNTSSVSLGVLSTGVANTATGTFSVRNYTSYGYIVQIIGDTPAYAGHHLAPMDTSACSGVSYGCASQNGVEQFGINLVANTSPTTVGADPVCQAAGFCYGVAGDGTTGTYGSTRPYTVGGAVAKYRYVSGGGETVASGPKSSGETDYTITFLANQSNSTPAGQYTGALSIVATGTY